MQGYDIIGDIHGHADALKRLLSKLGYQERDGAYRHEGRQVVFVGDFIDRGPEQREVLRIARAMWEAGTALAVMGNHEFNAIGWATPDGKGGYLREHTDDHRKQHEEFLRQIPEGTPEYADTLTWFKGLPAWLDLGPIRVIHACWYEPAQKALRHCLDEARRFTEHGFVSAHQSASPYNAVEILLKGPELKLPNGMSFKDKDGIERTAVRTKWWDPNSSTFRQSALGMHGKEHQLPDDPIPTTYAYISETPVFFGHYWLRDTPILDRGKAACLDFSVAQDGYLTAYQWRGEATLTAENLLSVKAREGN